MSDHARGSPSALHRIRVCPASLTMQEAFPHLPWEDAEASEEGTCAHWVLTEFLITGRMAAVGERGPAGVPVTEEMIEGAELAVEAIDELLAKHGVGRDALIVEKPVKVPDIHEECWGTPDIRFTAADGTVVVIDYKFGMRHVSEFENEQLVAYTFGHQADFWRAENVIIQPRSYGGGDGPVRSWSYERSRIMPLVQELREAVSAALAPNPKARATPDGCRNCRARHACPTLQMAAQAAMDYASVPQASELSAAALSTELRFAERQLKLLKARVEGMEAQALYLLEQGKVLPHHQADNGRGSTRWLVSDAQVIAIGSMSGINLAKPPKAFTVKQAVEAGLPEAAALQLSERTPGARKLAPFKSEKMRRIFGR